MRGLDNLTASAEADELYKLAALSGDPVNSLLVNTAYAHEMDLAQQQLSNADGEVIELLKRHLKETQRLLRERIKHVAPKADHDVSFGSLHAPAAPADLNVSIQCAAPCSFSLITLADSGKPTWTWNWCFRPAPSCCTLRRTSLQLSGR